MGAQLGHPAVVQHQNLVGVHQGGDPVGDEDGGAPDIFLDGPADLLVGLHVHGGEGVVENLDGGVLHEHPGDGHPLLLSPGDGDPPLPDGGLVPLGEALDGVVDHRQLGVAPHGLQVLSGGAVGDALPEGLGEEEGLLQHDADVLSQVGELDVPDVHPADGDGALAPGQLVEPVQQGHQGGLPRARGPQNAEGGPGLDGKAHVLQHLPGAVAEVHVGEDDVPGEGRGDGPGGIGLLFGV